MLGRFQEKLPHYYFKVLLSQNASSKAIKGSSSDIQNCSAHEMRCSWKGTAVFPVAFTDALHIICCKRMLSLVWLFLVVSRRAQARVSKGGGTFSMNLKRLRNYTLVILAFGITVRLRD